MLGYALLNEKTIMRRGGKYMEAEKDLRLFRICLKASKSIYRLIVEDVKKNGFTMDNFEVLELLYNKGPQYIQTISEKLMIPSGSITYVVNKLEEKGLVYKEQDENNRRYWEVCLTEEGEKIFQEIFPQHVETIQELLSPFDEEQKDELADLLKIIGIKAENQ